MIEQEKTGKREIYRISDICPQIDPPEKPKSGKKQSIKRFIEKRMPLLKGIKNFHEMERTIAKISTSFMCLEVDQIEEGINCALRAIGEACGADRSYVFIFSEDGKRMSNTHEWCAQGVKPQMANLQDLSVETVPGWMEQFHRFETIYIPSLDDLPPEARAEREILQAQNIRSVVAVPLFHKGSLVSFMGFDSVNVERRWPEEQIRLLEIVGGMVVNALNRRRVETALEYRISLEKIIAAIAAHFMLLRADEVDTGIDHALRTIGRLVGVDRSYLFMISADGKKLRNTHEWCSKGVEPQKEKLQNLSADALPWWMEKLHRFETIQIPRLDDLPPEAGPEKKLLESQDIRSLVVVPIVRNISLIGFLGFDSVRKELTWSREDVRLLKVVGGIILNTLDRRQIMSDLEESRQRFQELADNISDVFWISEPNFSRIIYVSPAYEKIWKRTCKSLYENPGDYLDAIHSMDRQRVRAALEESAGKGFEQQYRIIRPDGSVRWIKDRGFPIRDASGSIIRIVGVAEDITPYKQLEQKLRGISITDELTGLLNRRGFLSLADEQLKIAERTGNKLFFLFADLDGMKTINDTWGHQEGDKALIQTANLMKDIFRDMDIISRFGGDEFAILIIDASRADVDTILNKRLPKRLQAINTQEGRLYNLSISQGLVCYDPLNPCSIDHLLARADQIMYKNKKNKP